MNKMNEWDKNRSNQMFKNKITAAKSTLTKSTNIF